MAEVCTKNGCTKPRESRWRCAEHFAKGNLKCSVDGCVRKHYGTGFCKMHWYRVYLHGDTDKLHPTGNAHCRWGGDDVSYEQIHKRIRKTRGKASRYQCEFCDAGADHWAYAHVGGESERRDKRSGYIYSLDPDHYLPLCVQCHSHFDHPEWEYGVV